MKVLHTADWHIGQLFYEYDRTYEHEQFLQWLIQTLQTEQIELLLISGDVFDISNPSAASTRLFYHFLNQATRLIPDLQIIITAGNHDSPTRLEAPRPLLESSNIHIVGTIEKDQSGQINFDKISIPIFDKRRQIVAWCLAVPYLRAGDYPVSERDENGHSTAQTYTQGVVQFYKQALNYILSRKTKDQSIIALGHLHAAQAEITDMDNSERAIMGGIECIPLNAFSADLCYVALGHIHKAQKLGGKEHIRYSGSPIPLSFSEQHYKHQLITFELDKTGIADVHSIEIPISVPLLSVPKKHQPLPIVLKELELLPEKQKENPTEYPPYLEVRILLDEPRPGLRHQIDNALVTKDIRLAKIDVRYPAKTAEAGAQTLLEENLSVLGPQEIFERAYQHLYQNTPPASLVQLFQQTVREVNQKKEA
ncbi:Exodeoxyribonuclease I subunit D [Arachidicoccus rhizosphaerae]|jgi:exonuclease SbcD|uniref:Nuclease SbcCD subunit D n=1 Tax=Arachidicoccus rhizosphaerae TaxID=551991 RepID=A0A1H3WW30_9BACT|nr:exonuclease SbcCD subunit D C-terminal domain-containing protein [Arachidicoccus rhizosphaerae]SDZ90961.1 Exodeoxyribonuclease I subunit D [Arachidicoccus rhizosphaerae]